MAFQYGGLHAGRGVSGSRAIGYNLVVAFFLELKTSHLDVQCGVSAQRSSSQRTTETSPIATRATAVEANLFYRRRLPQQLFLERFSVRGISFASTMRLIRVQDYSLVEVTGPDDYPYAILSHTWNATGEVSFDDMKDLGVARARSAWPKIEQTCARARSQNIAYVWIDACCIDKSSSAELTEAINSMFEWYKKATSCYAYLSDLAVSPNGDPASDRARQQLRADLGRCWWFRRGWTLQELIAPKVVEFLDCSWTHRGMKASLRYEIALITNIDVSVLSNSEELSTIPVARKMSWASKRQTTRPEDIAYSLLGIFGVNLPLIYGEGAKAFIRLQEAIAQSTNDLSLFAWSEDEHSPSFQSYYGVLAQSPGQFASCRQLELIADPLRHDAQFFTITNRGVEFQTSLKMDLAKGDYLMHLDCRDATFQRSQGHFGMIAIRLVKTFSGFARHCAGRVVVDDEDDSNSAARGSNWDAFMRPVHVPEVITPAESERLKLRFNGAFRFEVKAPPGVTWELVTHDPRVQRADQDPISLRPCCWDPARSVFLTEGYEYFTGMVNITFSSRLGEPFAVLCGLMPRTTPPSTSATESRHQGNLGAQVNAWLAIHPLDSSARWRTVSSDAREERRELGLLMSQKKEMHYPRFLARLGQAIRARIGNGKALPNCAITLHKKSKETLFTVVSVSGTTQGRIHNVLISLEEELTAAEAATRSSSVTTI